MDGNKLWGRALEVIHHSTSKGHAVAALFCALTANVSPMQVAELWYPAQHNSQRGDYLTALNTKAHGAAQEVLRVAQPFMMPMLILLLNWVQQQSDHCSSIGIMNG